MVGGVQDKNQTNNTSDTWAGLGEKIYELGEYTVPDSMSNSQKEKILLKLFDIQY